MCKRNCAAQAVPTAPSTAIYSTAGCRSVTGCGLRRKLLAFENMLKLHLRLYYSYFISLSMTEHNTLPSHDDYSDANALEITPFRPRTPDPISRKILLRYFSKCKTLEIPHGFFVSRKMEIDKNGQGVVVWCIIHALFVCDFGVADVRGVRQQRHLRLL